MQRGTHGIDHFAFMVMIDMACMASMPIPFDDILQLRIFPILMMLFVCLDHSGQDSAYSQQANIGPQSIANWNSVSMKLKLASGWMLEKELTLLRMENALLTRNAELAHRRLVCFALISLGIRVSSQASPIIVVDQDGITK